MSIHHRMMLQRCGLGMAFSMHSQVNFDPFLTPLLSTAFAGSLTISSGALLAANVAGALAAGGDYWEFSR